MRELVSSRRRHDNFTDTLDVIREGRVKLVRLTKMFLTALIPDMVARARYAKH